MAKEGTATSEEKAKPAKKTAKAAKTKKGVPDELSVRKFDLTITLLEPMLGTSPLDPKIYQGYVESKKPKDQEEDESATIRDMEEKGMTGFHRNGNGPFIYDYMVKGFLKNAGNRMKEQIGITALLSKVVNFVFVKPRRIAIDMSNAESAEVTAKALGTGSKDATIGDMGLVFLERSIQCQTPQGPRVALGSSEVLPIGTVLKCRLSLLAGPISEKVLRLILDYGEYQGLGQWRTARWGSFEYKMKEVV